MPVDLQSLRLGFAFSLGTATFFAPCAFPLLPGYVAFYLGDDDESRSLRTVLGRAAGVGLLASLGFFLVYGALTGVVLAAGTRVLGQVAVLELVVGLLLVASGAAMALGRFTPQRLHVRLPRRRRTPTGFLVFGVVYAAAAAGCTAPFFIAIVSTALSGGPVAAVATLGAYAAGMSVLMVAVTVLSALGRETILRRLAARTGTISRVAGVVLVGAGLVQLYVYVVWYDGLASLGL